MRAAEKRAERLRNSRSASAADCSPDAAANRLAALRAAVAKGNAPAPRGLVNLGNTCFFNSVMQCLARVADFRDFFVGRPAAPAEGPMTVALRAFFVDAWRVDDNSVHNPGRLFAELGKRNPAFRGRAQQDAHEAMKVVFDAVVEEEKARLTKVARGLIPEIPHLLDSDGMSENSQSTFDTADDASDDRQAVDDVDTVAYSAEPVPAAKVANPERVDGEGQPVPSKERTAEGAISAPTSPSRSAPHAEQEADGEEEKPIPPASLISVIERTVGGVLSSTIVCKECGTKSAISEPFLDLQLPLVPKEGSESKIAQKVSEDSTVKNPGQSGAEAGETDADVIGKQDLKPVVIETQESTETALVVYGPEPAPVSVPAQASPATEPSLPPPPRPPPPPPPPPPPRRASVTRPDTPSLVSCDPMKEIRQNVAKVEAEDVVTERALVLVGDCDGQAGASSGDDTRALFDDDDDVEGFGLSSLFDTDFGGDEDTAADDVGGMTAFSTAEAAQDSAAAGGSSSTAAKKSPTPASSNPRRGPSFISSIFGGFGGISPAPHGYKSVVGSLEEFTKVELLEGDNAYGCDECTRREKLRIALQRCNAPQKKPVKSIDATAENCFDDNLGDAVSCDDISTEDPPGGSPDTDRNSTSSKSDAVKDTGVNGAGRPVLMSSPVTSSESSSGVSSEDDGELVIEEELEDSATGKPVSPKGLSREEEDRIIKGLNVDVPTVRTSAEKRFMVRDPPKALAIQLKRFTQVGYRGGLRKISGHVDFPMKLDLSPFVEEGLDSDDGKDAVKLNVSKRKRAMSADEKRKSPRCEYVLTGVSVHGGSLTGGHYTAYVREGVDPDCRGGWYYCNDSRIHRASEHQVLNSEAYLLFYERVL